MLVCETQIKPGSQIYVLYPECSKSSRARVVYRELTGSSKQISLALEFLGQDNFWQIKFPPAQRISMS